MLNRVVERDALLDAALELARLITVNSEYGVNRSWRPRSLVAQRLSGPRPRLSGRLSGLAVSAAWARR
jgi:hypothetical protein